MLSVVMLSVVAPSYRLVCLKGLKKEMQVPFHLIRTINITTPGGLYNKTSRSRNLWEMDTFRSKLVSSGLDKQVSLSKQTH